MPDNYDLAVIGAGVAGLSAALFGARLGLRTVLLDRIGLGGELINSGVIDSYPGLPDSISGATMVGRLADQVLALDVEPELSAVTRLEAASGSFAVHSESRAFSAGAVVVATGGRARKLGVPGEETLSGRGVSHCAVCDGAFFKDRDAVVVGGGDAAFYSALHLADLCRSVLVVHRRERLRAATFLQSQAGAKPNLKLATNATVAAIRGSGAVEGVLLREANGGRESEHPASAVFVCVGLVPESALLRGVADLDAQGRAIVDGRMAASQPGLYAAGAVRAGSPDQIITAAADGAAAAYAAFDYLDLKERRQS